MTPTELQTLKQSILDDIRVMMQTTGQVTQYIGARYVPLFADPIEWDDQREYEPLTVVTYQGNSYTTRQFTPKGTAITDESFWANTGNYNAQIEQYRNEVKLFDQRISNAQNLAESNKQVLDKLTAPKKLIIIGDSFSCTGTSDTSASPLWYEYVAKIKQLTAVSYAKGGAGFCVNSNLFSSQAATAIDENPESEVDSIVVFGGWNDAYNKIPAGELIVATINLGKQLRDAYPNANITFMGANTFKYSTEITPNNITLNVTTACIMRGALLNNCEFIDTHTMFIGDNECYMSGPNEHPSVLGEKMIAACYLSKGVNLLLPGGYNLSGSENFKNATGSLTLNMNGSMCLLEIDVTPNATSAYIIMPFRLFSVVNHIVLKDDSGTQYYAVRDIVDKSCIFRIPDNANSKHLTGTLITAV